MSFMQGVGINVAAGLLATAIANGQEKANATMAAQAAWRWLQAGKCNGDADAPVRSALEATLHQAGIHNAVQTGVLEGHELADVVTTAGPRLVLQHSTSFTPDLGYVLTTVLVAGYGNKAGDKPDWRNVLMVASAPMNLHAKTTQDTAVLVDGIEQAYADSGNEARIGRVNAAGHSADRRERQRAADTLRTYQNQLREAKRADWRPGMAVARRGLYWSDGQCAMIDQAVQDNATESARLLGLMLAGQLPEQGSTVAAPTFDAAASELPSGLQYARAAPREVEAMGTSHHLSRLVGASVPIGFFYRVLDLNDLE